MRITRNDIPVSRYTYTSSVSSDGLVVNSYTFSNSFDADLQPVGGSFSPALYGINSITSDVRKMFCDSDTGCVDGNIISAGGVNYMVKGVRIWYSHLEVILEPYDVVIA